MSNFKVQRPGSCHVDPPARAARESLGSPAEPCRPEDLTILGFDAETLGDHPSAELGRLSLLSGSDPDRATGEGSASRELTL